MDFTFLRKHPRYTIAFILVFFMALALVLRAIPAFYISDNGFLYTFDTDSYYTLRQIEVMVKEFPLYNWFDPMTAYPEGKVIDWGPLYPFIAALLSLIMGSTTHSGIIYTSGWVGPLMAAVMIPVMFLLGKTIANTKVGIVAAGLISVVSIQYFFLSSYGWVDHHIAEVLFSTLFFLVYIAALLYMKSHPVDRSDKNSFMFPVVLFVLTGTFYFLGLLASTTVILVMGVIALYTFAQMVLDYFSGQPSGYLLIQNIGMLSVSIIFLFLFGIKQPGVSFNQYSIGLVYICLVLIGETVLLYSVSLLARGKKWLFIGSGIVFAVVGIFLLQYVPFLHALPGRVSDLLFGFSAYSVGIIETLPWTLSAAWENFGVALILMAGGFIVIGYRVIYKRTNESVFLLIWSLVMLLLTIRFQRFVYFFTVNTVLLSAICIAEPFSWKDTSIILYLKTVFSRFCKDSITQNDTKNNLSKKPVPKKVKKNIPKSTDRNPVQYTDWLKNLVIISILILTIGLFASSLYADIQFGLSTPSREISSDWIESLEWLEENTPPTGIDYYKQYEKQGFSFPSESYGVMALWDAGHWITFFSHRIPITNPFQDNLAGPKGSAAFFLSTNESEAGNILEDLGGKYVITDSKTAVESFTTLVLWQRESVDISAYIKWFLIRDSPDSSRLLKVHRYDNEYFQTMVVRLNSFDGSMTLPETVDYIQYDVRIVPAPGESAGDVNGYARVIWNEKPIDMTRGLTGQQILKESAGLAPRKYADLFSALPDKPVQKVAALSHYRLIYESPENASVKTFPESTPVTLEGVKQVKIFEFVRGARILGEGIIEVPVVTNTGRVFVYRQESREGLFTVPYSTEENPYEVRTTGPYHIAGTSQYFNVSEADVIQGNRISG